MASPYVSPAYQQIVQWYGRWQKEESSTPIPLLDNKSGPDHGTFEPPVTQLPASTLDVFA